MMMIIALMDLADSGKVSRGSVHVSAASSELTSPTISDAEHRLGAGVQGRITDGGNLGNGKNTK